MSPHNGTCLRSIAKTPTTTMTEKARDLVDELFARLSVEANGYLDDLPLDRICRSCRYRYFDHGMADCPVGLDMSSSLCDRQRHYIDIVQVMADAEERILGILSALDDPYAGR